MLPLKLNLAIAENRLTAAKKDLATAEGKLRRKEKSLNKCKEIYCSAVAEKQRLANQAIKLYPVAQIILYPVTLSRLTPAGGR